MNFSFGAGAAPAAGGSTGFSFGSTPAATSTTAAEAVPVQPDLQQPDGRGPDPAQVSDQPSSHRLCPL